MRNELHFQAEIGILSQVAEGYMQLGDAANMSGDQLKQFIGVVKGSPAALQELAGAIQSLSDETLGWVEQVKGDKEEVETVFGEWDLGTAFPEEIRKIMSSGQEEFIKARAQIERVAETFGPAIASAFEMAGQHLRTFQHSRNSDLRQRQRLRQALMVLFRPLSKE